MPAPTANRPSRAEATEPRRSAMNTSGTNAAVGATRMTLDHDVATIRQRRGQRITVDMGSVWITHDGVQNDYCLGIGETYRIPSDGLTLVAALGHSANATITLAPGDDVIRGREPGL